MGCITLLSDLGLQDASVAIARGILMQHAPGNDIVDITHEITPFNRQQAAYLLGAAYHNFPAGTCHLVLFDIFSEQTTTLLLAAHNDHYFLAADNGILPLALRAAPLQVRQVSSFSTGGSYIDWLAAAAAVISDLPAQLSALPPSSIKIPAGGTEIFADCDVIHIDQYENVVLNVSKVQFDEYLGGRPFRLQFMQVEEINEISTGYTDVRAGYKLARFNSNGYLEICINRGRAASLFGLRLGSRNNHIKITFE